MTSEGPRNGPCSPWCVPSDLAELPPIKKAAERGSGDGPLDEDSFTELLLLACEASSDILYELSGRIFSGECGPVKVRPVERPWDADARSWAARFASIGWSAAWGTATAYGALLPGVLSRYGPTEPAEITLPYPIREVTEVKIDGIVIPPAEYELRARRTLVRLRPPEGKQPTARFGWPTTQDQAKRDDEEGTFSISFTFGADPPPSGRLAARRLAETVFLPMVGDTSRYPKRVTNISRQGVSTAVHDVVDVIRSGELGVWEVSAFLQAYNPHKLQRQARVWSPDVGRRRRVPLSD